MKNRIFQLLSFYTALGRPLTMLELAKPLVEEGSVAFPELLNKLETFKRERQLGMKDGFITISDDHEFSLARRKQDLLLDMKWKRLRKYGRWFRFVPFVDFVLVAGSLTLGNVHLDSDFDVLVGVRRGRIFTVRFFCVALFGALGIRRKWIDHKSTARDKICFNHFVTSKRYTLAPPRNRYWEELYRRLVPLFGTRISIESFFKANDWATVSPNLHDLRFICESGNYTRKLLEWFLEGRIGDFIERALKRVQCARIERHMSHTTSETAPPRIRYDNDELEFHPDTSNIQKFLSKMESVFPRG